MIRFKYIHLSFCLSLYLATVFGSDTLVINSDFLPENDTILIFSPKKNESNYTEFPVVYLLHGLFGSYSYWNECIDLQNVSDKYKFIIICPDGLKNSFYLNSPKSKKSQYVSFFINDLHPYIIANYPVDSQKIFITGNSMGGYGALNIYLSIPDIFWGGGSISGVLDLHLSSEKNKILSKLIGNYSKDSLIFTKNSILYKLNNTENTEMLKFLINCGTEDRFIESNKLFIKKCVDKNVWNYYSFSKGSHHKAFWTPALIWQLDIFYNQIYP